MPNCYEPMTRWNNVGLFATREFHYGVLTPWGNLIVKPWGQRLFSERYGYRPTLKVLGMCFTWVRLRRLIASSADDGQRDWPVLKG